MDPGISRFERPGFSEPRAPH
ncbi:MAG: hypothetical protein QOG92_529, partial [Verrucomicrobiota bacterium]|nr:hypothetical protein [Verrucomicrobiota bacterium]